MKSLLAALLVANCVFGAWAGLGFAPRSASIAAAPPPLNVPTVRLLSEVPPAVGSRESSRGGGTVVATAPAPPETGRCRAYGPFPGRDAAEAVKARLEEKGTRAEVVEDPGEARPLLVYVGPLESASEAARVRRELRRRDVDCQVIQTETLPFALSVGVFRRAELAQRQADRVASFGFQTRITPWGDVRAYRVVARGEDASPSEPCDTIAPAERFL